MRTTTTDKTFVRGNDRLNRMLADPKLAAEVAAVRSGTDEADRVYAMNLAMIRKAGELTQMEVARRLGVGQGVISRLEGRSDMLLSTLTEYLLATGASEASIVVTVNGGQRVELNLGTLLRKSATTEASPKTSRAKSKSLGAQPGARPRQTSGGTGAPHADASAVRAWAAAAGLPVSLHGRISRSVLEQFAAAH